MAYTSHGHLIPGTLYSGTPPERVHRCGGPRICSQCAEESKLK